MLRLIMPSILFVLAFTNAAQAALIIVNTLDFELNNDGDCSLREAIQAANTNVAVDACPAGHAMIPDAIYLAVSGSILVNATMTVTQALTISGNGTYALTLHASASSPVFLVDMANPGHDALFTGFTIGNAANHTGNGSAIQINQVDRLTVSQMRFVNNRQSAIAYIEDISPGTTVNKVSVLDSEFELNTAANWGGGAMTLRGVGEVIVERSRFINNRSDFPSAFGDGGAINLARIQSTSITDSFFLENVVLRRGGAISILGDAAASVSVLRSTFSNNEAMEGLGGAVNIGRSMTARLVNTTFHDNGNSIYVALGSSAQITHSTFHHTRSGYGHLAVGGTVEIGRSALYGPSSIGGLCTRLSTSAIVSSGGYNRFHTGDDSCEPSDTDLPLDDPRLLPLGNYGGHVPTLLPRIDSPLIDDADVVCHDELGNPVTDDARLSLRPVAASGSIARCDVGAVEWNPDIDDYLFRNGFNHPSP